MERPSSSTMRRESSRRPGRARRGEDRESSLAERAGAVHAPPAGPGEVPAPGASRLSRSPGPNPGRSGRHRPDRGAMHRAQASVPGSFAGWPPRRDRTTSRNRATSSASLPAATMLSTAAARAMAVSLGRPACCGAVGDGAARRRRAISSTDRPLASMSRFREASIWARRTLPHCAAQTMAAMATATAIPNMAASTGDS